MFSMNVKQSVVDVVVVSDSIVEHRVLGARTFDTIFEYSNFRVIDPSIRVVEL